MQNEVARNDQRTFLLPAYNVHKEDDAIILRIEMPGVDRENLEITVENNQLYVTGHRVDTQESGSWLVRERRRGDYRRVFTLDDTTDPDAIDAQMAHGVVVMRIGFKAAAKPRRIEVKSS